MKTVGIKVDVPDITHRELKAAAARAGVKLNAFVLSLIVREVGGPAKPAK